MKKIYTWNIKRLVDESFIPATQQPSVLYWRLLDFLSRIKYILLTIAAWIISFHNRAWNRFDLYIGIHLSPIYTDDSQKVFLKVIFEKDPG